MFIGFFAAIVAAGSLRIDVPQTSIKPKIQKSDSSKFKDIFGFVQVKAAYQSGGLSGQCVLDSGCPTTVFRPEIIDKLQKPSNGDGDVDAVGPLILGRKLYWAKANFYRATPSDVTAFNSQKVDGIIGLDLLSECRLLFSNKGTKAVLEFESKPTLEDAFSALFALPRSGDAIDVVPIDLTAYRAYIPIKVGKSRCDAILDTGSSGAILLSKFVNEVGARRVGTIAVSTLDGDENEARLEDLRIGLTPDLSFTSKFNSENSVTRPWDSDPDDPNRDVCGLVGLNVFSSANDTVLDLPNREFLAKTSVPRQLASQTKVDTYPLLPSSAGPLVVRKELDGKKLRVYCPLTNAVFDTPIDSAMPKFVSEAMVMRHADEYARTLGFVVLAPGQSFPGWSVVQSHAGLRIAYPPSDMVYIPPQADSNLPKVGTLKALSSGGKAFTPNKAAPSPPNDTEETPPRGPLVSEPGNSPTIYTCISVIAVPDNSTISCPVGWSISEPQKGLIYVANPASVALLHSLPIPPGHVGAGFHWAWYSNQWVGLPNSG